MRAEFRTDTRGYVVTLNRDLFGAHILMRRWFGLANRRGGSKTQVFLSEEEASKEFWRVQKIRARRGYRLLGAL